MDTFNLEEKKELKSRSGIMLPVVELVIAIGLFAVISVFILRFFTSANAMSKNADDISKAVIRAESALELAKALSFEEVAGELGSAVTDVDSEKQIEVNYDKNWEKTEDKAAYSLSIKEKPDKKSQGTIYTYKVVVVKHTSGNEIVLVDLEGNSYKKGGE